MAFSSRNITFKIFKHFPIAVLPVLIILIYNSSAVFGSSHSTFGMAPPYSFATPPTMDPRHEEIVRKVRPFYGSIVDTIIVTGNTRTREITITREMATKQGKPLDPEVIFRDTNFLLGLAYFSDVEITAVCTVSGRCQVNVHIEERAALFMKYPYPILNYDFKHGVSYGVRWKIKNFRGLGQQLFFKAEKRRDKEHSGNISWHVPWTAGHRIRTAFSFYTFRKLEEPLADDFVKELTGGSIGLGMPLSKSLVRQVWLTTGVSFEYRNSCYYEETIQGDYLGDYIRQNFVSFSLGLQYDSRDNYLTPWKGLFSRISVRRFLSTRGPEQQYIFYNAANYIYLPFGASTCLILAANAMIQEGDVPSFSAMGLGGTYDLRGYDGGLARGNVKLLGTVQLRRRLIGTKVLKLRYIGNFDFALNGILFVDNGALMWSIDQVGDTVFHTTGGFGFEILSPIQDLIRIEFAFNGNGAPAYYFTSGLRF